MALNIPIYLATRFEQRKDYEDGAADSREERIVEVLRDAK
jgi:hypothetical protein